MSFYIYISNMWDEDTYRSTSRLVDVYYERVVLLEYKSKKEKTQNK